MDSHGGASKCKDWRKHDFRPASKIVVNKVSKYISVKALPFVPCFLGEIGLFTDLNITLQ